MEMTRRFGKAERKCLACGYSGEMKTWLANYSVPQFLSFLLLLFYVIPGLIFIGWNWKKYKCPKCGALGKNVSVDFSPEGRHDWEHLTEERTCPFCAEVIKAAATVCRYCGRDLPRE